MRQADSEALSRFDIEPIQLMEAAGLQTARLVASLFGGVDGKRIAVVCGSGNNGGDAMVAARYLRQRGARVTIVGVPPGSEISLNGHHLRTIKSVGIDWTDARAAPINVGADLIVDGLLGTGVRLPLRPQEDGIIEAINRVGAPVVSIDVPSGLDADTGAGMDRCVRATATVTLGLLKQGLPGCQAAGRVFLADIGLPADLFGDKQGDIRAIFAVGDLVELV
jgi:NAD(P)H-hydrate epimerase